MSSETQLQNKGTNAALFKAAQTLQRFDHWHCRLYSLTLQHFNAS